MAVHRTVELSTPPPVAYEAVKAAVRQVGKLEDENDVTRTLVAKVRYGLNPVRLRVSVITGPTGQTSLLEIGAKGQDVWGAAARKATDKVIAAIR